MILSKLPKLTFWRVLLFVILAIGAYSTFARFCRGLGASTNLSDRFPWGLWIGFDVLCGVGTAAGGFTLAAIVYIFHLERFRPIIRPAILIAFLGYARVGSTMLFEVGRPIRIWYPLILWNPHSVLFEVAWCVMLYVAVAGLEFAPVILERLGWEAPKKALKAVMFPLVFFGILLSTMHQSSLGSLFLIVPTKLHPYWYSPLLPLFFIVSAIGVGLALLILASHLCSRAFGASIEHSILVDLGKAMAVVMLVYATLRFQDLWARGTFAYLRQPTVETVAFLLEVVVGVILPIILLLIRRVRENPEGLFAAAVMVISGFLLNRLNVAVTGLEGWAGGSYFPRWTELGVSFSTVAAAVLVFGLATRYLHVFPASASGAKHHEASGRMNPETSASYQPVGAGVERM